MVRFRSASTTQSTSHQASPRCLAGLRTVPDRCSSPLGHQVCVLMALDVSLPDGVQAMRTGVTFSPSLSPTRGSAHYTTQRTNDVESRQTKYAIAFPLDFGVQVPLDMSNGPSRRSSRRVASDHQIRCLRTHKTQKPTSIARPPLRSGSQSPKPGNQVTAGKKKKAPTPFSGHILRDRGAMTRLLVPWNRHFRCHYSRTTEIPSLFVTNQTTKSGSQRQFSRRSFVRSESRSSPPSSFLARFFASCRTPEPHP
jgi:hypothetical protein